MRHLTIFAACVALAATPGCAAQPPLPVVQTPSGRAAAAEHHPGKMIFAQLVTPDAAGERHFYSSLFGWTFQDVQVGPTDLSEAFVNGRRVAEIIGQPKTAGEHGQPGWLTFISTPNVDAASSAAVQHGGKLLFGPNDIPNLGRQAVLADPQGAVFALLTSARGDPPDTLARQGDWIWSSLITGDPEAAAGFYQPLFNADVFDLPGDHDAQHLILASDDFARASINPLPPSQPDAPPYWLNFVRVPDTAAAADKVTALGGHVLVPPQIDRHGGRIAVVADPGGTPLGLMEWTDTAVPGGAK